MWKIAKTSNLENSKHFQNFTISKIIQFLKLLNFEKKTNFQNFTIWNTIKIPQIFNIKIVIFYVYE